LKKKRPTWAPMTDMPKYKGESCWKITSRWPFAWRSFCGEKQTASIAIHYITRKLPRLAISGHLSSTHTHKTGLICLSFGTIGSGTASRNFVPCSQGSLSNGNETSLQHCAFANRQESTTVKLMQAIPAFCMTSIGWLRQSSTPTHIPPDMHPTRKPWV
jgi:hypothetical protein